MTQKATSKIAGGDNFHPYSLLAPRFWHGMTFSTWVRLLGRNRLAVSPTRIPLATTLTLITAMNSALRGMQELIYGRRAAATRIEHAPLFIVGHWRSGTTLLHELLVRDAQHTFPNTYECFGPNHFLLTEKLFTTLLAFLLPARRPMDNMAAGWSRPQEDEFALANLGAPSPYLFMAFPNRGPVFPEYLDLNELDESQRRDWEKTFMWFLKRITMRSNRRIVLKSPTHTARIRTLLRMFPDARFVHIIRDPYTLFPSTVRMWRSLCQVQGLQIAREEWLEDYVLDGFVRLYERYEEDKSLIESNRLFEIRYEDLVSEPIDQLRALYDHLELGDFEEVLPRLLTYLDELRDYKTNRYELPAEKFDRITDMWGDVIRRYGYDRETPKVRIAEPSAAKVG